ncbi:MAG: hypothetical protein U7123_09845 [Potamolinea sp.]
MTNFTNYAITYDPSCQLPITMYQLPILPITNHPLPITNYPLPNSSITQ